MRFILACLLFVASCSLPVFTQQTGSAQQGEVSYHLWRVRSQTITEDLIKDAPDLTTSERALLWARLAQRWWRDEPEKAYSWMLKPIEMVEAIPNKEATNNKQAKIKRMFDLLSGKVFHESIGPGERLPGSTLWKRALGRSLGTVNGTRAISRYAIEVVPGTDLSMVYIRSFVTTKITAHITIRTLPCAPRAPTTTATPTAVRVS